MAQTHHRWVVLSVVAITYMLGAADRANLAVALPFIKRDFHLSNAQVGATASVFFIGVTAIQIPGSLLIQKIRVQGVMIGAILLTSLATLLTGMARGAPFLLAARTLLGVAEGPLPVGGLTTISRWFPLHERGTAVGIFSGAFKLAPAMVPPISAAIIYAFGWRAVFFAFAAPGFILAVLWYFTADEPDRSRRLNAAERAYIRDDVQSLRSLNPSRRQLPIWVDGLLRARTVEPLDSNWALMKSLSLWGCSVAYMLMAGVNYAILTWIPTYLVEVKKYRLLEMGTVSSAPWVGAVLGSIIGGLISDRLLDGRRKPAMLVTAASMAGAMYTLILAPNDPFALGALFLLLGFLLAFGYSTFVVYPMGLAAKHCVPFAVSVVSTLGALGAGLAPLVIGFVLDYSGWPTAFTLLSISSMIAFALLCLIIEPRPQATAA